MAHDSNLAVQPLNHLPFISRVKGLLQQFFFSFFLSTYKVYILPIALNIASIFKSWQNWWKQKGTKFWRMCTLGRLICFLPVHKWRNSTHWIPKYALDALTNVKAIANLEHLMNIKVLLGLSCVLMLLEVMHKLIKI